MGRCRGPEMLVTAVNVVIFVGANNGPTAQPRSLNKVLNPIPMVTHLWVNETDIILTTGMMTAIAPANRTHRIDREVKSRSFGSTGNEGRVGVTYRVSLRIHAFGPPCL